MLRIPNPNFLIMTFFSNLDNVARPQRSQSAVISGDADRSLIAGALERPLEIQND